MNCLIEDLARNEATYQPGATVAEHLRTVTMAPVIGPVAVGKSTCMDFVVGLDPDFGRVQSFTTRPRRDGESENEYRFLPHTKPVVENIARLAGNGELVQYAVHPTTHYIYGSDKSDYSRPYMMLDTLASTIGTIRQLPYGRIVEMTLVTEPEEWAVRFARRNTSEDEAKKRLREGIFSLEWSLEQGSDMAWVCTPAGTAELSGVAEEMRGIIRGEREPVSTNRLVGERLLGALREKAA